MVISVRSPWRRRCREDKEEMPQTMGRTEIVLCPALVFPIQNISFRASATVCSFAPRWRPWGLILCPVGLCLWNPFLQSSLITSSGIWGNFMAKTNCRCYLSRNCQSAVWKHWGWQWWIPSNFISLGSADSAQSRVMGREVLAEWAMVHQAPHPLSYSFNYL